MEYGRTRHTSAHLPPHGEGPAVKISDGGLDDPRVQTLLAYHFRSARSQTAPGSAHALDLRGLTAPNALFWHAAAGDEVIGIGALKRLSALPVADLDVAAAWYSQHFGMTEVERVGKPVPTVILERTARASASPSMVAMRRRTAPRSSRRASAP
jgi:hypothetical protein